MDQKTTIKMTLSECLRIILLEEAITSIDLSSVKDNFTMLRSKLLEDPVFLDGKTDLFNE